MTAGPDAAARIARGLEALTEWSAALNWSDIPEPIRRLAMDSAAAAHRALGCRGISRADFRYDDTAGQAGELYLLEINTQPGMTPTSLVPEQAAHLGIAFPELVSRMVEGARCDR